ncbi:MAG: hypothetical protein C5B43_02135 [Verrucomicrobia bacterium]|nr:MAG: hypothetical protein C5B43_02135 [Verrucomicrobiota bacterium]
MQQLKFRDGDNFNKLKSSFTSSFNEIEYTNTKGQRIRRTEMTEVYVLEDSERCLNERELEAFGEDTDASIENYTRRLTSCGKGIQDLVKSILIVVIVLVSLVAFGIHLWWITKPICYDENHYDKRFRKP